MDFRTTQTDIEPISTKDQSGDFVKSSKYLGTVMDEKLSWTPTIDVRSEKAHAKQKKKNKKKKTPTNQSNKN